MDNVTHALAGGLIAAAGVAFTDQRVAQFGRTAAILGVVAAEFPDVDLVYVGRTLDGGNLAYLLHHRGHTHTLLFALISAIVLWALALAVVRECRAAPFRWSLLVIALAGTCSHLLLDYTNNYGVHPFWPIESSWYYGDAVFIVEPWLWIMALPVIWYFTRLSAVRVASALAFAAILIAAWSITLVGRDVALVLTVGALLWAVAVRAARADRRWLYGVIGWFAVEAMFFVASMRARVEVRSVTERTTLRDVSLTPSPGNPLCYRALAVEVVGAHYQVTAASVAPFPSLRSALTCAGLAAVQVDDSVIVSTSTPLTRRSSPAVHWDAQWVAPRADLVQLVKQNCEIAAALHFMRTPFWRVENDGRIVLTDLRFGDANGGFAAITTPQRRADCMGTVPGWRPPRADILTDAN